MRLFRVSIKSLTTAIMILSAMTVVPVLMVKGGTGSSCGCTAQASLAGCSTCPGDNCQLYPWEYKEVDPERSASWFPGCVDFDLDGVYHCAKLPIKFFSVFTIVGDIPIGNCVTVDCSNGQVVANPPLCSMVN